MVLVLDGQKHALWQSDSIVCAIVAVCYFQASVAFRVKDSAGNMQHAVRAVIVQDTTPPNITLLLPLAYADEQFGVFADDAADLNSTDVNSTSKTSGLRRIGPGQVVSSRTNLLAWNYGIEWKDPGIDLDDNLDSEAMLRGALTVVGSVNVSSPLGTESTIVYAALDGALNKASATRVVRIVDTLPPVIRLLGSDVVEIDAVDEITTYVDPGLLISDMHDVPVEMTPRVIDLKFHLDDTDLVAVSSGVSYLGTGRTPLVVYRQGLQEARSKGAVGVGDGHVITYTAEDKQGNVGHARRRFAVRSKSWFSGGVAYGIVGAFLVLVVVTIGVIRHRRKKQRQPGLVVKSAQAYTYNPMFEDMSMSLHGKLGTLSRRRTTIEPRRVSKRNNESREYLDVVASAPWRHTSTFTVSPGFLVSTATAASADSGSEKTEGTSSAHTRYMITQETQLYTMPFDDASLEGNATLLRDVEAKFKGAPGGSCLTTGGATPLTVFTAFIYGQLVHQLISPTASHPNHDGETMAQSDAPELCRECATRKRRGRVDTKDDKWYCAECWETFNDSVADRAMQFATRPRPSAGSGDGTDGIDEVVASIKQWMFQHHHVPLQDLASAATPLPASSSPSHTVLLDATGGELETYALVQTQPYRKRASTVTALTPGGATTTRASPGSKRDGELETYELMEITSDLKSGGRHQTYNGLGTKQLGAGHQTYNALGTKEDAAFDTGHQSPARQDSTLGVGHRTYGGPQTYDSNPLPQQASQNKMSLTTPGTLADKKDHTTTAQARHVAGACLDFRPNVFLTTQCANCYKRQIDHGSQMEGAGEIDLDKVSEWAANMTPAAPSRATSFGNVPAAMSTATTESTVQEPVDLVVDLDEETYEAMMPVPTSKETRYVDVSFLALQYSASC